MQVVVLSLLFLMAIGADPQPSQTLFSAHQAIASNPSFTSDLSKTIIDSLKSSVVNILYPDSAEQVLAELDACSEESTTGDLPSLSITKLLSLCSKDSEAAADEVIQFLEGVLPEITKPCEGLSVNITSDFNNLIASVASGENEASNGEGGEQSDDELSTEEALAEIVDIENFTTTLVDNFDPNSSKDLILSEVKLVCSLTNLIPTPFSLLGSFLGA